MITNGNFDGGLRMGCVVQYWGNPLVLEEGWCGYWGLVRCWSSFGEALDGSNQCL